MYQGISTTAGAVSTTGLPVSRATYYRLKHHKQWLKHWWDWVSQGIFTPPLSDTYKHKVHEYLLDYFSRYNKVSSKNLNDYLRATGTHQYSLRKWKHSSVSSMARYLVSIGKLDEEELIQIKALYPKKPVGYRPKQNLITTEQLNKLLTVATKEQRQILILLSETGLRVSELANLRLGHCVLDEEHSYINVKGGKGDKDRIVPLSQKAKEQLLNKDIKLLDNRYSIISRLKRLSDSSGLKVTPHSLRHYRITEWANDPRIPLVITQEWSGHSDIKVTMGYVKSKGLEYISKLY